MPARNFPEKFLVALSFAGEQRDLVRSIAEAVEAVLGHGTVFLDEWFEHYIAGHDADITLQEIYAERCELAVVCVSANYGNKPWNQAEHEAVRSRVMQSRAPDSPYHPKGVLPIRVADGDLQGIPFNAIVPDVRMRSAEETATLIINRLRLVVPDTGSDGAPASSGWPDSPPALNWSMANRHDAREAFGELLTSGTPWRFLRIRGASETGKSHITRQMLANALAIPDVVCGRFDFKGTTNMGREMRSFIQELGVAEPPENRPHRERLSHVLNCLRETAKPTLLIFDTYEMVGETEDWVEDQLLPGLVRASWLRVAIAGQRVPASSGAVWATVARPLLQLEPPPPPDWFEFGKRHRPGLTLTEVETACKLAAGKASLLSQLLGPAR